MEEAQKELADSQGSDALPAATAHAEQGSRAEYTSETI